ncbi:host cell division inhibitor Icd-like protein [Escherichia coli]|nr:host cell division inhibitor Icd-like protein [Escherichia coli]EHP9673244.1 host cell division inhibitor Icd-like protein [Escherichia coli]
MNITKSAPLPERPCEQLTCCEKNGSVQGNYINRVTKRHNCQITGKEKATCHDGPSTQATRYPQRMSIANNATFAAGGQRVNSLNFAQLRFTGLSFSYTRSGIFFSALAHALSLPTSSLLMQYFMRNANTNREPSQYGICCISYSVSAPLDFLRWRRLISSRIFLGKKPDGLFSVRESLLSVIHQPLGSMPRRFSSARPNSLSQLARLTPSLLASLSNCSFNSGTIRIWNGGVFPVPFCFLSRLITVDMCTPMALCFCFVGVHLNTCASKNATPRSGGTHAGRLTTNDRKSIEAAMRNHTTHPQGRDSHNLNKYIWRFIALSTAQPRVITIEATSEQEARQQSPAGCVMVFAARIRQGVSHVQ